MEELNNVQAVAAESEQEEKKTLSEGEFYYEKENEEVKYGEKILGMKWFGFYRWFLMGIVGFLQLIGFVVLVATGAAKEVLGDFLGPAEYPVAMICSATVIIYKIYLFFSLPKFTKRVYKANFVWLVIMPFVENIMTANIFAWIADIILSLLNVVYFQKRSFMFGIKKEECREKYKLKSLAGPAAALILPMIIVLIVGIAGNAADEKDAIVNADEDYKTLAQTVGFDSTREMEKWLEENCDVDFSDMETFEKLEYVISTNMGAASYEEAEGSRDPFSGKIIKNRGDYQIFLMKCIEDADEPYLYSDKEQIYHVTIAMAKETTDETIVAKFNELAKGLGYEDYLELLQSFDNWKDYEGLSPRKQFEKLAEECGAESYEKSLGYGITENDGTIDSFADYQDCIIASLTEE